MPSILASLRRITRTWGGPLIPLRHWHPSGTWEAVDRWPWYLFGVNSEPYRKLPWYLHRKPENSYSANHAQGRSGSQYCSLRLFQYTTSTKREIGVSIRDGVRLFSSRARNARITLDDICYIPFFRMSWPEISQSFSHGIKMLVGESSDTYLILITPVRRLLSDERTGAKEPNELFSL